MLIIHVMTSFGCLPIYGYPQAIVVDFEARFEVKSWPLAFT